MIPTGGNREKLHEVISLCSLFCAFLIDKAVWTMLFISKRTASSAHRETDHITACGLCQSHFLSILVLCMALVTVTGECLPTNERPPSTLSFPCPAAEADGKVESCFYYNSANSKKRLSYNSKVILGRIFKSAEP